VAIQPSPVPERAVPRVPAVDLSPRVARALEIAFALVTSWVAAGALVVGVVWAAVSTLSPEPPAATAPETLPYALAWIAASLAMLSSSVASTFTAARVRRIALLRLTAASGLTLLVLVVAGYALG
jgi:hypothetical protein